MTWKEAIISILQRRIQDKESEPMHYKDITDAILVNGLKATNGRTPSLTVSASLTTNRDLFIAVGNGIFTLSDEGKNYRINTISPQSNNSDVESQEESILNNTSDNIDETKIIKHFGIYWSRESVKWNDTSFKLLGKDSNNSVPIDFRKMRGIYLLYDFREVVYVGQAMGNNSIANRLKDHTHDRHANRWNRFSWFGIDIVNSNTGEIIPISDTINIDLNKLVDALEGLLIEGLEPRQNRRSGNNFGNEYDQYIPEIND